MSTHRFRFGGFLLASALGIGAFGVPLAADDRDLLREASGNPYVFFILDTSGSMHWSPTCLQEDIDAGICSRLCPTGDCAVPLNGDDPDSKLYLAKSALYDVLTSLDNISFGFATYNQDSLGANHKHWMYEAQTNGVSIPGWGSYPAIGQRDVFGFHWICGPGTGSDIQRIGCDASDNRVADLNSTWERTRVQRLPKGGDAMDQARTFFVRSPSFNKYAITFTPSSGSLGAASVVMRVKVQRCKSSSCPDTTSGRETGSDAAITYRRVEQFISWEFTPASSPPQDGYFRQGDADMAPATNTCSGWDPNTDTTSDTDNGVNLRFPTVPSGVNTLIDVGDVVPFDWRAGHDNRDLILGRLAPNLNLGETTPNFTVARYLQNQPVSGVLPLADSRARAILGNGATPLGASVSSFRAWYSGCGSGTCPNATGWRNVAAAVPNSDFGCRKAYLIVLTDGNETCSGAPCTATRDLFEQDGVKTFVVGFGTPNHPTLQCMAANGGTRAPILPKNKQELIDALTRIFDEIREESRSFASAAVPSVQAAVDDKVFLTSFTPLNDESVWSGHLESFLKPLPLTPDNLPDRSQVCTADVVSGCFAWDAADQLFGQAPTAAQLAETPPEHNLGEASTERRVLYGQVPTIAAQVPRNRRLFEPPPDPLNVNNPPAAGADWIDLLNGMGLPLTDTSALQKAKDVIRFTLETKSGVLENDPDTPLDDETINFLLGDIFHSNPVVLGGPENFTYFIQNKDGYEQFSLKNRVRRKVVFVGSNDGQLHAFDAGSFSATVEEDPNLVCRAATAANRVPKKLVDAKFSNGTGKEIFSYIPRKAMPALRSQSQQTTQVYSVDSPVAVGDVFIDPISSDLDPPTAAQREWRSVLVGGQREGGSGIYALDVTTPDKIDTQLICGLDGLERVTSYRVTGADGYVPYCMGVESTPSAGDCGPLPYPAALWEFEDTWDEDGDTHADLGRTWSIPTIGRIQVCRTDCDPTSENNDIEDRYVAIFGGGLGQPDPEQPVDYALPGSGNYLYMVDIATGKTLYKSKLWVGGVETQDGLEGMVPSEPAVVDTNLDGYADRIYVGTTSGKVYKWDISAPGGLRTVNVLDALTGQVHQVLRVQQEDWAPLEIFDTEDRPIFFPPSVVFVGEKGQFALTFGTGDRASLWEDRGFTGRFFSILDEDWSPTDNFLPLTAAAYPQLTVVSASIDENLFLNPIPNTRPGWYLELDTEERVITKPFVLSGVLFFTSYQPDIRTVVVGDPDAEPATVCASSGVSRVFTVLATNGTAVFRVPVDPTDPNQGTTPGSRYKNVPEFVTDPFVELSTTKNQSVTPDDPNTPDDDQRYVDDLCSGLESVSETLSDFFPDNCKFANYSYNIETIRSDRGLVCIAPVPICIVEQNWTEK